MATSTTQDPGPRIPAACGSVQVNFCKNPHCSNFGVPPVERPKWSRPAKGDPKYKIHGTGKDLPGLKCQLCEDTPPLKSNIAVKEELDRMLAETRLPSEPTCPNDTCKNNLLGVATNKSEYYRFGTTKGGSQRYKCKSCSRLFSQAQSSTAYSGDRDR